MTTDRKQFMRELILNASLKIFTEEGLEALSIRRLTKEINYSIRTIYIYYKNKNEILEHLHDIGFEKLINNQKQVKNIKDPIIRLIKHLKAIYKFAMGNPGYYRLMFMTKEVDDILKEKKEWDKGKESYNLLKEDVLYGFKYNIFPQNFDLDEITFTYWSYIHGMCSTLLNERYKIIEEKKYLSLIDKSIRFLIYKK